MKNTWFTFICLVGFISFLLSCENDKSITTIEFYTPEEYQILSTALDLPKIPDHYEPFNPSVTDRNFIGTLGRVLFYDVHLSDDNSVSCGSCHKQQLAFADDVAFSTGIRNRITTRNTLALGVFKSFGDYSQDSTTRLFWDGRARNLHDQMVQTIRNPNEMGMEMSDVVEKIKYFDYYQVLTRKAFGTEFLDETMVLVALERFINSISSRESKFDMAALTKPANPGFSQDWEGLSAQENQGKRHFEFACGRCHSSDLVGIVNAHPPIAKANNGLDLFYTDQGEGELNPAPESQGIFKIPSLRNIELTAPYMHDGRFATLEDVVDFYNEDIQPHPNLSPLLKVNGEPRKLNFSKNQKDALVQFLKTLTDHELQNEVKWSDPFL